MTIKHVTLHIDPDRPVMGFITVTVRRAAREKVAFRISFDTGFHLWGAPAPVLQFTRPFVENVERVVRDGRLALTREGVPWS